MGISFNKYAGLFTLSFGFKNKRFCGHAIMKKPNVGYSYHLKFDNGIHCSLGPILMFHIFDRNAE